jgi:hypothetical protein
MAILKRELQPTAHDTTEKELPNIPYNRENSTKLSQSFIRKIQQK